MSIQFLQMLVRWAVLALGVALATRVIPGLEYRDGVTLAVVVVVLSVLNAVLRPVLVLFTLPFVLLTMGLGVVVINALLFMLAGALVDGFLVESFWSALGGSLIVSLVNVVMSSLMRPRVRVDGGLSRRRGNDDDVIDV